MLEFELVDQAGKAVGHERHSVRPLGSGEWRLSVELTLDDERVRAEHVVRVADGEAVLLEGTHNDLRFDRVGRFTVTAGKASFDEPPRVLPSYALVQLPPLLAAAGITELDVAVIAEGPLTTSPACLRQLGDGAWVQEGDGFRVAYTVEDGTVTALDYGGVEARLVR